MSEHIDEIYKRLLEDILDNGELIQNGRTAEAYCSVFGRQYRVSLRDGFPLLTTKKVPFRLIASELLWFLSGSSNVKDLQAQNNHIWDEWADKDGNLGPMYGHQLRNLEQINFVERRLLAKQEGSFNWPTLEEVVYATSTNHSGLLGKKFASRNSGEYIVVGEYQVPRGTTSTPTRWAFDVQFSKTGFIQKNVTKASVLNGLIKDPRHPSVEGVGCLGETYTASDKELLYQTWVGMLKRCYNPQHVGYENYGKRGIKVADAWLNFSTFCQDVKKLPNWDMKLEYPNEYSLDKDYYGSDGYSKDTCIWLSKLEQNLNREDMVVIKATSPAGEVIHTVGIKPLCKQFGFKAICIHNCLEGKTESHHGWKFERITSEVGNQLIRVRRVDQLKKLVARIKHFPSCRRLVVSAWNVMDLDQMALAPCHMAPVQFHVANGRLSCHLYQRSADAFLGVPFNIASYALLTHMIAQVTGLEVGEFVHTFGDLHIYETHLEQVKEQLQRSPMPLPQLWLDPSIKNIDAFKLEDIRLDGYESHPAIKGDVAV